MAPQLQLLDPPLGRRRLHNADWPCILGKVSGSEKNSRRSRRMESYKQKRNVINLLLIAEKWMN